MSESGFTTIIVALGRYYIQKKEEREAREQMKRAALEKAAYEAQVERQQAEWRAEVENQKLHGDAGDATESEAIAALGGRGVVRDGGFS